MASRFSLSGKKLNQSQKSQARTQDESTPYFKEVLIKVGIKLRLDDSPNTFSKEQSLIIRDCQKELQGNTNYPANVQDFIIGLTKLKKKQEFFKKSLLPSELKQKTDSDNVITLQQESVMRIFLSIDCLQSEVITLLLDEVAIYAVNDEENTSWVRLLLGPIRYLAFINKPEELTNKLLEILDAATFPAQLEILNYIPEIIPDNENDRVAKNLIEILQENSRLTAAVIDCLNYLTLSPEMRLEIQDSILAIMQSTDDLKIFPAMFHFLVSNSKQNLDSILLRTRSALDSIITNSVENQENDTDQVLTFEEIKSLTVSSKTVAEGWLNLLTSIKVSDDHKPVDILILLMLHSMGNRKHPIETLFKRKIKKEVLKNSLIEKALKKFLVTEILKDYLTSILHVAGCLLHTHSEQLYLKCARTMYCTTFMNEHANKQQRQQILGDLLLLTGSGNKSRVPTLNIIQELYENSYELLQPHTNQLMNILDKIEDLNLGEVKLLFNILCGLICGPNADRGNVLQNELHIIIRKQLSSSKRNIKYRGIIAAIAMAKNFVTVLEQSEHSELNMSNDSICSISGLPNENSKQAATLLMLISTTLNCPLARGLYYDQLGQMIFSSDKLDKYFMGWLYDVVTNDFQTVYITEEVSTSLNEIPLSTQFNLNKDDEIDSPIVINISEMIIKPNNGNNLILTMASLFRLLRLVHYKYQSGALSSIDALLGCGVLMPDIDIDIGLDTFDILQNEQIVDCLFHCINWFRELISAFITQKGSKLRIKILNRLRHLVELEEMLYVCMKSVPNHRLPLSYFHNSALDKSMCTTISSHRTKLEETTKIDKMKTTKSKTSKNMNDTTKSLSPKTQVKAPRKSQTKEKEFVCQFREMDTDIIILFKYPITMEDSENKPMLSLLQYKFLMTDLVGKLQMLSNNKFKDSLSNINMIKLDDLITDCVRLMPNINMHLIKLTDEIKELLVNCDHIHDSCNMFLPTSIELKTCFSLTIEMIGLVVSWPGFQSFKHLALLRECLKGLVGESTELVSVHKLIMSFLNRFDTFIDCTLILTAAVNLVNLVKALLKFVNEKEIKNKLVSISKTLLSTKWFNSNKLPETGMIANLNIAILLKMYISGSNIPILGNIVSWVQKESKRLSSKDDCLITFPSITKANFPLLYRAICSALVEILQSRLNSLTNDQHLDLWRNTAIIMIALMDIIKVQETRPNLVSYLKNNLAILKLFNSHGIPILEIMLQYHSEQVVEILRLIQQTTRFIHNLCCYSKMSKDMTLIAHVPQMRLTLEKLIYRVKAMLVANKCESAFWMGNLRNKNLKGEEIALSQESTTTENEGSDDELPPDDESDQEVIESEENESVCNDSASEIF